MNNKILSKVFMWMFLGLMITFISALYVSTNENMIHNIFSGNTYLFLIIAQIVSVVYLSVRINKMSVERAKVVFILYSLLTGITFSSIFLVFNIVSIIYAFLATSFLFLIFSLIGNYTSIDLSKMGIYLFFGLIVIILGSLFNIFFNIESFDFILIIFGIIVFLGFIAYDIQKIKNMAYHIESEEKLAIFGALQLYLDFINLFIRILNLVARNRD